MRYRYTSLPSQCNRFIENLTSPSTVVGNQGSIVGAPTIDRGMVCDGMSRGIAWNGAVLEPMQLPGLLALIDPAQTSSIAMGATPDQTDLNAEQAGVGLWVAINSTPTKETLNPYSGLQWMKVLNPTAATGSVYRSILTTGERYLSVLQGHGDGGAGYLSLGYGGAILVSSTTDMAWQSLLAEGTASAATWRAYAIGGLGAFAGFDAAVVSNLSFNTIASLAGVAGGFQQLTSASKLWVSRTAINGRQVIEADSDYMAHTAAASTWDLLHRDQDWYWFTLVQPVSLAALRSLTSTRSINSAVAVGMGAYINTTGTFAMNIGNGAATVVTGVSAPCFVAGTPALLVVRHAAGGNVEAWVGGTRVLNLAPTAAWDTVSAAAGLSIGSLLVAASTNPMVGRFGHCGVGAALLTDPMLDGLGAWAKRVYGVAWV